MPVPILRDEKRAIVQDAIVVGEPPSPYSLPALTLQYNPVGPVQIALVEEAARRADQMHEYDAALRTLQQRTEVALQLLIDASGNGSRSLPGAARASTIATAQHESILRQGLASARGLYRALAELENLQAHRQHQAWDDLLVPDPRFATERDCVAYLVRRYTERVVACAHCGRAGAGCCIATRLCWECRHCKSQTGIRVGTCMEHSSLPLTKWFTAIRAMLLHPRVRPAELAKIVRIDRFQTVREMAKRIRQAVAAENATALLAGLDEVYLVFV